MEYVFSFSSPFSYASLDCVSCDGYHHLLRFQKGAGFGFYLQCIKDSPRKYVRRVCRMTPLLDWEVKSLLLHEFFCAAEEALNARSTWAWCALVKRPLKVLEDSFSGQCFVDKDFLLHTELRIQTLEDVQQSLKEQRLDYEQVRRSAVFPKKAILPKVF